MVVVAGIRSGVGAPLPAGRSLCSVVLMRGCEFPHAPPPVREPGWQWCKACLRAGSSPSTHHRADHFGLYSPPLLLQRSSFASRGFLKQETLSNGVFLFFFFLSYIFLNESGCVVSPPQQKLVVARSPKCFACQSRFACGYRSGCVQVVYGKRLHRDWFFFSFS